MRTGRDPGPFRYYPPSLFYYYYNVVGQPFNPGNLVNRRRAFKVFSDVSFDDKDCAALRRRSDFPFPLP